MILCQIRKLYYYIPPPAFPGVLFGSSNGAFENANSETAWLDGVRGFAAVVVTMNHIFTKQIGFRCYGFHAQPVETNTSFLQLPPIRIFFAMEATVPLFFVISGYCLSIPFVRRLQNNPEDTHAVLEALSSAMFRRGIRLFMPFLTMALVSQVLLYLGAYRWKSWSDQTIVDLIEGPDGDPRRATIYEHVHYLYEYLSTVVRALNYGFGQRPIIGLNPALWTIPAEFRGSLLIYICFLSLARVRSAPRFWILAVILFVLVVEGMWELFTFVGGLLIAELHERWKVLSLRGSEETTSARHYKAITTGGARRRSSVATLLLWTLGLYLLCLPRRDAENGYGPIYDIIKPLVLPKWNVSSGGLERNFYGIGGMLCIAALGIEPVLRRPFESRLGQYFGRISFSLYLLHQLIARMLMHRSQELFGLLTGRQWSSFTIYSSRFAVVFVMLWASEIVVELLDRRSIVVAKRTLERLSVR